MKCEFCKSELRELELKELVNDSIPGFPNFICENCPNNVFYTCKYPKKNDSITIAPILSIRKLNNYFFLLLNKVNKTTTLYFVHDYMDKYQTIYRIDKLLDITPSNFDDKIKTIITFS